MLSVDKINNLKAENERLKSEVGKLTQTCGSLLNIQYALADSCKKYSECLEEIKEYCENQNLKADYTACEVLDLITKAESEG